MAISKSKANLMIADLKKKLGGRLDDSVNVNIILVEWLNEHIGIADTGFDLKSLPSDFSLDTSEGIV